MTWILTQPIRAATKPFHSAPTSAAVISDTWYGLYVDAASYAPGDTINIYASAPDQSQVYRLVRLDADWTEITLTNPITVGPQQSKAGSFIEFPAFTLSGRTSFTLEGWYFPTQLGGDWAVVAGQMGLFNAAAGIVISPTGELAGYVSDTTPMDLNKLATAPPPADFQSWLDTWHHLALTYDGAQVKLYIDGVLAAQRAQTGAVAPFNPPFRLGARSNAPGNMTGVIDGRIDSWAVWPAALTPAQIETRRQRGLTEGDPLPNNLNNVDLYVGFEETYPTVADASHNGYTATVYNHGNPGVSGILTDTGHAFRLNHDQIVDAGWQVTAQIAIPTDTESGMYAIQALDAPFTATQTGDRLSVRAFAIRPADGAQKAPIAVILPTNTWNAYNHWPGSYNTYLAGSGITPRSRFPLTTTLAGGNNSAYKKMGDGVSPAYYHGLRRPSKEMSPIGSRFDPQGTIVRAPGSMYLTQWLDAQGYAYDVYSDDDFDAGIILASDYRVVMPNAHHEYWSDGMLDSLTQFLNDGGSVVALAGNIFTWRVIYGTDRVVEVRKFLQSPILGLADMQSGIDGRYAGNLEDAALCNGGNGYQALGVQIHLTSPCKDQPFCYGRWAARNADHWLWQGSGLTDDARFGDGRPIPGVITPTYALGHEVDTWVTGMPLPGLAAGQQPVILAEGTDFDLNGTGNGGSINNLLGTIGQQNTCQDIQDLVNHPPTGGGRTQLTVNDVAGTILYFPHSGGGDVLVIGASATPWALESDAALSGLTQRALNCFAYDQGCGYNVYLPTVTAGP
ncbi:MAG: N,N-dimethylformamidase beta subunit family domain-containing protein [Anaerolineae bacterium]